MKYALLSDIHANMHALDACLAHAHKQGIDRYAILGDLVGYGANPAQVVERCQALQNEGAIVLRGNHEELIQSHNLDQAHTATSYGDKPPNGRTSSSRPRNAFGWKCCP